MSGEKAVGLPPGSARKKRREGKRLIEVGKRNCSIMGCLAKKEKEGGGRGGKKENDVFD